VGQGDGLGAVSGGSDDLQVVVVVQESGEPCPDQ